MTLQETLTDLDIIFERTHGKPSRKGLTVFSGYCAPETTEFTALIGGKGNPLPVRQSRLHHALECETVPFFCRIIAGLPYFKANYPEGLFNSEEAQDAIGADVAMFYSFETKEYSWLKPVFHYEAEIIPYRV